MLYHRTAPVVCLRSRALLCQEVSHSLKHVRVFQDPNGAVRREIFGMHIKFCVKCLVDSSTD